MRSSNSPSSHARHTLPPVCIHILNDLMINRLKSPVEAERPAVKGSECQQRENYHLTSIYILLFKLQFFLINNSSSLCESRGLAHMRPHRHSRALMRLWVYIFAFERIISFAYQPLIKVKSGLPYNSDYDDVLMACRC